MPSLKQLLSLPERGIISVIGGGGKPLSSHILPMNFAGKVKRFSVQPLPILLLCIQFRPGSYWKKKVKLSILRRFENCLPATVSLPVPKNPKILRNFRHPPINFLLRQKHLLTLYSSKRTEQDIFPLKLLLNMNRLFSLIPSISSA